MIKPTIGRVVLFHPGVDFKGCVAVVGNPLPALISHVWSDSCINIGGFDANGVPFAATSVFLHQGDGDRPGAQFAEWMPYQKVQVAKEATTLADAPKPPTAPRVTPDQVDATIVGEDYHVFPGTTLTVCCLTLKNGFTVTGESACASPENFDAAFGRKLARDEAKRKIWALEGYALRNLLTDVARVQ